MNKLVVAAALVLLFSISARPSELRGFGAIQKAEIPGGQGVRFDCDSEAHAVLLIQKLARDMAASATVPSQWITVSVAGRQAPQRDLGRVVQVLDAADRLAGLERQRHRLVHQQGHHAQQGDRDEDLQQREARGRPTLWPRRRHGNPPPVSPAPPAPDGMFEGIVPCMSCARWESRAPWRPPGGSFGPPFSGRPTMNVCTFSSRWPLGPSSQSSRTVNWRVRCATMSMMVGMYDESAWAPICIMNGSAVAGIPQKFAVAQHTGHPAGPKSPDCISCHMPARTYMVVDRRHDHSFRIPRPDLTVKIGAPNTCNACHADKSAQWAADAITRWHGPEHKGLQTYAEAFQRARDGDPDSREALIALAKDPLVPGVARGAALVELASFPSSASARGA